MKTRASTGPKSRRCQDEMVRKRPRKTVSKYPGLLLGAMERSLESFVNFKVSYSLVYRNYGAGQDYTLKRPAVDAVSFASPEVLKGSIPNLPDGT
jgi:hypothetical protein